MTDDELDAIEQMADDLHLVRPWYALGIMRVWKWVGKQGAPPPIYFLRQGVVQLVGEMRRLRDLEDAAVALAALNEGDVDLCFGTDRGITAFFELLNALQKVETAPGGDGRVRAEPWPSRVRLEKEAHP